MKSTLLGIRGYLIDAPQPGNLRAWSDGAILVEDGLIAEVGDYSALQKKPRQEEIRWIHSPRVAVFPGLIDLHTHLPQYPVVARGGGELLPWLRQTIFPVERDFTLSKSRRESPLFFGDLARCGTTTAMVYGANLEESCDAAFEAAQKSGLRVILGKMLMDTGPGCETHASKTVGSLLLESERLCKKWHGAGNGLLEYAFSPRFALSCSDDLMRGASELAGKYSAYLQTHLAENREEIEKVRSQFPWATDYTDVYEKCGILGPKTVLGHCIHLSEREKEALAATHSNIAHCPTSNLFLGSGIMPLDQFMDDGIHTGLGSDVAAGPELNLWQVMRSVIESQKARSFYEKKVRVPSPADALFLATQGGADALGKGDRIGALEIGREADLTVVDFGSLLPSRKSTRDHADLSAADILGLCIYRGGPQATVETFVRGESVYRAMNPALF
ncbi:MAG: guanine deaminase [Verrucomicrobiota bacterium]